MPLTEKGREIIRRINETSAKRRQERLSSTAECPIDGLLSNYIGHVGGPTYRFYVYECPNGDIFKDNGELIPPERRTSIRLES